MCLDNSKQKLKRIYLSPPHVGRLEEKYAVNAIRSNWVAPLGPQVEAFEKEIATYIGMQYALSLSSGTAALHLALKLCGVSAGDRVFCSSLTFSASANVILYENATPVFVDCDPETWTMSAKALQAAFRSSKNEKKLPKAVIIVNLYGQSADYDSLIKICNEYSVPVIEDAAESLGSLYRGNKSGSCGSLSVLSFNGNKIITTSGGGALLSNNTGWIEKASFLATQAREKALHYEHRELGYNYRLSNILAAIGRAQMRSLDKRVEDRRRIFDRYFESLSPISGVKFMLEAPYGRSNRWLTTLMIDPDKTNLDRTIMIQAMERNNIEARPVWKPMHLQPLYQSYEFFSTYPDIDISGKLFYQGLCLPSGSNLSEEDQARVISCFKETIQQN